MKSSLSLRTSTSRDRSRSLAIVGRRPSAMCSSQRQRVGAVQPDDGEPQRSRNEPICPAIGARIAAIRCREIERVVPMRVRTAADLADRVVQGVCRSELPVVFVQDQSRRGRSIGRISRPAPGGNLGDPRMAFLTQPGRRVEHYRTCPRAVRRASPISERDDMSGHLCADRCDPTSRNRVRRPNASTRPSRSGGSPRAARVPVRAPGRSHKEPAWTRTEHRACLPARNRRESR